MDILQFKSANKRKIIKTNYISGLKNYNNNPKKLGFTLLELMIVMLLMGLMATIIIPTMQSYIPGYKRKEFLTRLETLIQLAWQQAFITQKAHRVFFDLEKKMVRVERAQEIKEQEKEPHFEPITIPYLQSSYQWPEHITIKNFYIHEEDLLARRAIKTEKIWFYSAPDGLVQPVIINMIDTAEIDRNGNPVSIGLVINPFNAHVERYEEFQKPS